MTKTLLQISDALSEVEIFMDRARVMVNDVEQGYFGKDIKSISDAWKIMPPFYDVAEIKMDIAICIIYDMQKQLKELQALVEKVGETEMKGGEKA